MLQSMGSQKVGHDLVSEPLNGNIKIFPKIPTQRSLKLEYKFIPMVNFWSCSAIAEGALRVWMELGLLPGPSLVGRGVDPSAPYKGCWEHQVFHETQLKNTLKANVLNPTDEWCTICKLWKSPALRADIWARVYSPRLCGWCCKDQERNSSKGGKKMWIKKAISILPRCCPGVKRGFGCPSLTNCQWEGLEAAVMSV